MAICITAGEQSENHVGMNINGKGIANSGFSVDDLKKITECLDEKNVTNQLIILNDYLNEEERKNSEEACVLIIRDGVNKIANIEKEKLFSELINCEWDKHYWDIRRKKVLNKKARYNLCFGNNNKNPDYENKQGTIISYENVPLLKQWRESLKNIFGEKASELELEGNLYYNIKKCGIGFHGDGERKKVIACNIGSSRPIHWQWYERSEQIGERIKVDLNDGDMYIMSEKASGFDWKKKIIKTIRHAAGEKYVK